MPKHDTRVDTYIAKSGDFANPILQHLRETIHTALPAAFKEHIRFGF